jgi:pimeloyl-ACP methyl ester carboxylesterase
MLELLNPSLPGAARAMADLARFRLRYAVTPAAQTSALIARRFMTPSRRDAQISAQHLLADLRRFAPEWSDRLGTDAQLSARMTALLAARQCSHLQDKGDTVVLHQWQPVAGAPKRGARAPHALLSHGWESYGLSYALVIERLRELGFAVTAVDHVAHGESGGDTSGLPRFAEVLHTVAQHLAGQGIGIDLGVGHSLGGGAWLMAATRLGVQPRQLLLLAPFIDTPELLGKWLKLHGLPQSAREGMQHAMLALHGPTTMAFADMDTSALAARLSVPTTVLQDPKDFIAPMRHARRLAEANPLVRCVKAPGVGHVGVLFHPTTLDALAQFKA